MPTVAEHAPMQLLSFALRSALTPLILYRRGRWAERSASLLGSWPKTCEPAKTCRIEHRMLLYRQGDQMMPRSPFATMALVAVSLLTLSAASVPANESDGCNIKGNVSTRGERIYHVPGQRYYNATRISASHGERWFCSEAEARAAGWRRSRV